MIPREIVQPMIEPISRKLYKTSAPRSYLDTSGILANKPTLISIAEGFEYDGASVPQIAWTLTGLTPDGLMRYPSLPHDWIYEQKGRIRVLVGNTHAVLKVSHKNCDKLFLHMLKEQEAWFVWAYKNGLDAEYGGLEPWRIRLAYTAVRVGGGFMWKPWE